MKQFLVFCIFLSTSVFSQQQKKIYYTNPVLPLDYSDPDVIRVGNDYYMIASSFNYVPAIPILHSTNLINWNLIGYALDSLTPSSRYNQVQAGKGVWAPSIRFHDNEFWIYYPDPDTGIFLIKSKHITGPWSTPILVQEGKGLIDPCPFWDTDGSMYLIHAYAGSRASTKSILVIKELIQSGEKVKSPPVLVYDGHFLDPTVEGPKLYKRNGYYYIFAPAGGVTNGWQLVLRSKSIWGPYERKVVLEKGKSSVNGPHQGAWVESAKGENWFLHFQDKDAFGRIVHLQPMRWIKNWPAIGEDADSDGIGNPVSQFQFLQVATTPNKAIRQHDILDFCSDEFNKQHIGYQWQWPANPREGWLYVRPDSGLVRLVAQPIDSTASIFYHPAVLTQKLPLIPCSMTVKFNFQPHTFNDAFGMAIFGKDIAYWKVEQGKNGLVLKYLETKEADKTALSRCLLTIPISSPSLYLRISTSTEGYATFSYSMDGNLFIESGENFLMKPGIWIGARVGLFMTRTVNTNDAGYTDLDWIRFEKTQL